MPDLSRYDDVLALLRGYAAMTPGVRVLLIVGSGELAEAHTFYLRFAFTPLVELLRTKHSPARHDFGLRYLDADLPQGYAERLHELLPGPDLGDRATQVFAWTDDVLARLGH